MKATGIVRRIDDLGRIVIPKEIRRTLHIRKGETLEIFTNNDGTVILKKYSPFGDLGILTKQYVQSLSDTLKCIVCITDTEQIIAISLNAPNLQNQYLSTELSQFLETRNSICCTHAEECIPVTKQFYDYKQQIIYPILCNGDLLGCILFLSQHNSPSFGHTEQTLAKCSADFLARQFAP